MPRDLERVSTPLLLQKDKSERAKAKSNFLELVKNLERLEQRVAETKADAGKTNDMVTASGITKEIVKFIKKVFFDKMPPFVVFNGTIDIMLMRDQLKKDAVYYHTIFQRDVAEKELQNEIDRIIDSSPKVDYTPPREPKDVMVS